jgi:hypothetical protein
MPGKMHRQLAKEKNLPKPPPINTKTRDSPFNNSLRISPTRLWEIHYLLVIVEDAEGLIEIKSNASLYGNAECFSLTQKGCRHRNPDLLKGLPRRKLSH